MGGRKTPTPSTERSCADCARSFVAKHAKWCPDCRWRHRKRKPRHGEWTPERDSYLREHYGKGGRAFARQIAEKLGMPRWRVTRRAAELGLSIHPRDRRPWTPEEERTLLAYAGQRSVGWIARRLGRTVVSVATKMKREKIRRRFAEGYTLRELQICFGVDHRVIERWARDGKLDVQHSGVGAGPRERWLVTDAAILRFVQAHPMAFDLRRVVDQWWFMDLVLGGKLVERALQINREIDDGEEAA